MRTRLRRCMTGVTPLICTTRVLASAGGGNHSAHSHVSHGSNGNHNGSTSGADLSWGTLIFLVIVTMLIRHIVRRLKARRTGGGGAAAQPVSAASAAGDAAQSVTGSTVDAIRTQDPDFEIETFLQRAEMTFFLVKRGLQNNDVLAIRPHVDDTLFAALSTRIAQTKLEHRRIVLESLNVRGLALENAVCSTQRQTLQVHFDLVYRAKTLDESRRIVSDEGEDRKHAELWTFMRSGTARTPSGGGVVASKCPACGAELRLGMDGTCAHCKSVVTNGTFDWVACDIQDTVVGARAGNGSLGMAAPTLADGLAMLMAADKAFSMDAFKRRAKTAFLALQDAWCKQTLDSGRAFLSPGAYFAWSAQLEAMSGEGRRNVMEHLSIQTIEPLRLVHGRVFDDLTVRITAVAADFEVDQSGRIVFGDRTVRPFAEDWTFQRSIGVSTSTKPGTLENTCPSCGAPLSLTQIGECRYCKAAVVSGRFDWVVSRIEQEDGVADTPSEDVGERLAVQVGGAVAGAVVGGLLNSLLSEKR